MHAISLRGVTALAPHIGQGCQQGRARRVAGKASPADAGMSRMDRLLAPVASIDGNVLRRLGLQEDASQTGQAVQGLLPVTDFRARVEFNLRRTTP